MDNELLLGAIVGAIIGAPIGHWYGPITNALLVRIRRRRAGRREAQDVVR